MLYRTKIGIAGWATALVAALTIGSVVQAKAADHEVTVTVNKVKPLDKADDLSDGDFFAKVTIGGFTEQSPQVTAKGVITPKWKLSHKVPAGVVKVKVELVDKDVSVNDPIDINKVGNKRDLDFTVNTNSCRIEGFSSGYRCGSTITRAGSEAKKAEISFVVSVKK